MSKIIVTGGAGFIGSHITDRLIKDGHNVIVLDNLSAGKRENVPSEAKFIEGDSGDVNLLRDVFASEKILKESYLRHLTRLSGSAK